jgi:Zn-finger nucleic acid-binding protein
MTSTRHLVCPKRSGRMGSFERSGILVEQCEDGRGMFLDRGELERLIDAEGGGWSGVILEPSAGTPAAPAAAASTERHGRRVASAVRRTATEPPIDRPGPSARAPYPSDTR